MNAEDRTNFRPGGVRLIATGMAVPDRVVSNHDLARTVDTSDEWITQRTGIKLRRVAEKNDSVLTLASSAMNQALQAADLSPDQLDLLICATLTPQMTCPSTAARVVAELGAVPAGAMDISAACSGFVYGINHAWALIRSGVCRTVGVIGVEVLSKVTDWDDRRTCILFGDGAGAAVFSAGGEQDQGCLHQAMGSDGARWGALYLPKGPEDLPQESNGFSGKYNTLQMNGREVYKFAVTRLQDCIDQALSACGIHPADLAMVIPHQSNIRILESVRERIGLPEDRMYINIDRYGNTSAASVPICLHELRSQGRLSRGDLVLFVALGGGLTWASSVWRL